MTKEMALAKLIYEAWGNVDAPTEKQKAVVAARVALGRSEDGRRDLMFEALCQAMGADWKNMPKHEAARYNEAAKQLREINARPEEVVAKARRYEFLHPDWPLTPTALITHWSSLSGKATSKVAAPEKTVEVESEEETVPPPPEFLEAMAKMRTRTLD